MFLSVPLSDFWKAIRRMFYVLLLNNKDIHLHSGVFAVCPLQFEEVGRSLLVPFINQYNWAPTKGRFNPSPLHWGCVPVHTPLLAHVRVADPVRMYPMSQEKWQICPGKLLHGAKLPWAGAVNRGQLFTISRKKKWHNWDYLRKCFTLVIRLMASFDDSQSVWQDFFSLLLDLISAMHW